MKTENLYKINDVQAVCSPSLVYFKHIIESNIELALKIAGGPGRLRPHIKSHKTIGLVNMLQRKGINKFKCATVAEAEMLAMSGVKDILLAYPIVGPNIQRIARFLCLYPEVSLKVLGDDQEAINSLSSECVKFNRRAQILIDVNPGMDRTGIPPNDDFLDLYTNSARLKGIELGGIHCYDGHNHQEDFQERMAAAGQGYEIIRQLKNKLETSGLAVPLVIMGGTPTFPCYAKLPEPELSPGTCFLQDWGYQKAFADLPFIPAGLLLTRVVSRPQKNIVTLDLGYKGIASDPPQPRGVIHRYGENAVSIFQNEEHWVFRIKNAIVPKVGQELLVIPTHICPTSALYSEALVVDEKGDVSETWPILSRNRRIFI